MDSEGRRPVAQEAEWKQEEYKETILKLWLREGGGLNCNSDNDKCDKSGYIFESGTN
jgi:hypothetical protein